MRINDRLLLEMFKGGAGLDSWKAFSFPRSIIILENKPIIGAGAVRAGIGNNTSWLLGDGFKWYGVVGKMEGKLQVSQVQTNSQEV